PPALLGAGNVTRASGGPHGHTDTQTHRHTDTGAQHRQQKGGTCMSYVFVVDAAQRPLTPVHPGAARRLLTRGEAAVWRHAPFTLILKRAVADAQPALLRLKIDPGSTTTGLALVDDQTGQVGRVVWAGELAHRGGRMRSALLAGRALRSGRRQRHTRY